MLAIPNLEHLFHFRFAAPLAGRFGHMGAHVHRAAGVAFGAKLFAFGIASVVALAVAVMATRSASDWMKGHFEQPIYARSAGVAVFVIVLLLLGLGAARLF